MRLEDASTLTGCVCDSSQQLGSIDPLGHRAPKQLFLYHPAFCLHGFIKASERKKEKRKTEKKTEKCKVLAVVVSRMGLIKSGELRPQWAHQAGLKCTFSISWALACLVIQREGMGTSLAVQWLRLHAPSAGGLSSILGLGTKIPCASQLSQKTKQRDRMR